MAKILKNVVQLNIWNTLQTTLVKAMDAQTGATLFRNKEKLLNLQGMY
jgi:hypothetical protein